MINPTVERVGAFCWRLIGIGIVALAVIWLLARLWVVVLALAIAVLFSRALDPVVAWLRRHGWRPGLAAAAVMLGFAVLMGGLLAVLVPVIAAEFEDLGPTLEDAVDDFEDWLVEDSPFDVSRQDFDEFRSDFRDQVDQLMSESGTSVVDTTLVVFEVFTALVLALITSFFMLKDGDRFGRWVASLVPVRHRDLITRQGRRAWSSLGGYLRGAAILGILEGTIIGLTLWIVGAGLSVPVAVITFFAAFIPFVGAIVAGVIAVLVALVGAGLGGALAVAVVAVIVQQLDNDLLAPVIYGRALHLHPLVILFSITAGGALLGPVGILFAVPFTAVTMDVIAEARDVVAEANAEADAQADAEAGTAPDTSPE